MFLAHTYLCCVTSCVLQQEFAMLTSTFQMGIFSPTIFVLEIIQQTITLRFTSLDLSLLKKLHLSCFRLTLVCCVYRTMAP